jgi:ADP-ribosylglycohydrolase
MTTILTRCEGAFVGHAIASQYDPSIFMALNVSDSLLDCREFNGSDILSRHLYLYHTKKCEIGEITKYIYQEALKHNNTQSSITREHFRFDQSIIDETVKSAEKKYDGRTAGCSPAQRSYPLAFCAYISDNDLVDCTLSEAKLTHYSSLAGEVALVVNLICRSLLKNTDWNDAVNAAFTMPNLHEDIKNVLLRYRRWPNPAVETHAAYAPTVLNAALHYVESSRNPAQAIANAYAKDKHYCTPIVGILAGARWGIPEQMFKDNINDSKLKTIRETANKLINLWNIKLDAVSV